jgi:hypothetical protein
MPTRTTTTPERTEPTPAGVLSDDRGAILVAGIFMCTCLVGALWYLAGIGDAILYRERLQETADAVAFTDAAMHARGMNLIVVLNLIMAVVLGIRVVLKIAQLILTIAAAVFGALGIFVWPFMALAAPCAAAAKTLEGVITNTRDPINKTLEALSMAQTGLKEVTRGTAMVATRSVADSYSRDRKVAFAISGNTSILQEGLPVADGDADKLCREAGRAVPELVSWALSHLLPGNRAAEKSTNPDDKKPGAWISERMGELASVSPQYFCEIGSAGSLSIPGSWFREAAEKRCEGGPSKDDDAYAAAQAEWERGCREAGVTCTGHRGTLEADDGTACREVREVGPGGQKGLALGLLFGGGGGDKGGCTYEILATGEQEGTTDEATQKRLTELREARDRAAKERAAFYAEFGAYYEAGRPPLKSHCEAWAMSQMKAAQEEQQKEQEAANAGTQSDGSNMLPKRVADSWKNGGADAQSIGFATGEPGYLKRSAQLVRVARADGKAATWNPRPAVAELPSFAQAEYFFDCVGDWEGEHCNEAEDAMWHLKWRARLRRVHWSDVNGGGGVDGIEVPGNVLEGSRVVREAVDKSNAKPDDLFSGSLEMKRELTQAATRSPNMFYGVH